MPDTLSCWTRIRSSNASGRWIGVNVKYAAAEERTVTFENFDTSINGGEPIRGVDISSIISIENAGVEFFDTTGNKADIFETLSPREPF